MGGMAGILQGVAVLEVLHAAAGEEYGHLMDTVWTPYGHLKDTLWTPHMLML